MNPAMKDARGLLSIGDFSKMTFLSVKTLRHYHDVGLLAPAYVDPHSGYRYYGTGQVGTAQMIRRLRDLDMPVGQVRRVIDSPDDRARNAVIAGHLQAMSNQLEQTRETVESLRRMLDGSQAPLLVERRRVAPISAVAIREDVTGEEGVAWWVAAFTELHSSLHGAGLTRGGPDGALFAPAFFSDGAGEVVAFVPVTEMPGECLPGRLTAYDVPGEELAMVTYDGPMIDLDRAYGAVGSWVSEQALASAGPVREYYLPNGDVEDLLDHRTEIGWPVAAS